MHSGFCFSWMYWTDWEEDEQMTAWEGSRRPGWMASMADFCDFKDAVAKRFNSGLSHPHVILVWCLLWSYWESVFEWNSQEGKKTNAAVLTHELFRRALLCCVKNTFKFIFTSEVAASSLCGVVEGGWALSSAAGTCLRETGPSSLWYARICGISKESLRISELFEMAFPLQYWCLLGQPTQFGSNIFKCLELKFNLSILTNYYNSSSDKELCNIGIEIQE